MEQVKEILVNLTNAEKNGFQSLREGTGEPAGSCDFKGRLSRFLCRVYERIEEEKLVPLEHFEVPSPDECPFVRKNCGLCRAGEVTDYNYGDAVKKVYSVSKCYAAMRCRELLKKCGLAGAQLGNTFENALTDTFNEGLFSGLKEWDYKAGRGIYIASAKNPENPQGNGTGKSYALHALTRLLCEKGVPCLYARGVDFLQELKASYEPDSNVNEFSILSRYVNTPVLLLDDLGKESFNRANSWAPEKFYYVVDERINRGLPIIISSNFGIEELEAVFGRDNYGPAIVSRLAGHCEYYLLGGPDRRIEGL